MSQHSRGPWKCVSGEFKEDGLIAYEIEFPEGQQFISKANVDLISAAPDLLEALKRLMPVPMTGNPSEKTLREFWEYEQSQGRGEAEDVLFAMDAIAKATGGAL